MPSVRHFFVEDMLVDPSRNTVQVDGETVRLEPKVMEVLCALADESGKVVTREHLIDAVWGIKHGGDESLTRAISILRKTLRTDQPGKQIIETIPKRGYRFQGQVRALPQSGVPEDSDTSRPTEPRVRRQSVWRNWYLAPLSLILGALVFAFLPSEQGINQSTRTEPIVSIAVLPFENLSDDPQHVHFSRGISEEVLNALSNIEGVRVVGRTSSFAVVRDSRERPKIVDQLNSDYLLDGSVRINNNRVRVIAQLIDANEDEQIWSEVFDRDLEDVFAIQSEIGFIVEQKLRATLGEESDLVRVVPGRSNPSLEDYELYLFGIGAFQDRRILGDEGAISLLERVSAKNPDFTQAKAYLAVAYALAPDFVESGIRSREATIFRANAERTAREVLEVEPDEAKALSAIGLIHWQRGDFASARSYYQRAISVRPNDDTPAVFLAMLLRSMGDNTGAKDVLSLALQSNPSSPNLYRALTRVSMALGDWEAAQKFGELAWEFGSPYGLYDLALVSIVSDDGSFARYALEITDPPEGDAELAQMILTVQAEFDQDARARLLNELRQTANIGEQLLLRHWGEVEAADSLLLIGARAGGPMYDRPSLMSEAWYPGAVEFRASDEFRRLVEYWNLVEYWDAFGFPAPCQKNGVNNFHCDQ